MGKLFYKVVGMATVTVHDCGNVALPPLLNRRMLFVGDDISVADPEDVLDRFMAKQQYKR